MSSKNFLQLYRVVFEMKIHRHPRYTRKKLCNFRRIERSNGKHFEKIMDEARKIIELRCRIWCIIQVYHC